MHFSTDIETFTSSQWDPDQLSQWAGQRLKGIHSAYISRHLDHEKAIRNLYALLDQVSYLGTAEEGLEFPTLFSRLAYLRSLHNIHGRILFGAQSFRKQVEQRRNDWTEKQLIDIGFWVNDQLISVLWNAEPQLSELDKKVFPLLKRDRKILTFERVIKGVILGIDDAGHTIRFLREDEPEEEKLAYYNEADRNEIFTKNIEDLGKQKNFPVQMHLWEVEVDQKGHYHPKAFVIEPDFLIDVTAISACFGQKPLDLLPYILRKFTPTESAPPLLKGNIANYILDQLLQDSAEEFSVIFAKTFHLFPLDFAILSQDDMRKVFDDAKDFYLTIQKVVHEHFEQLGIGTARCAIEPSFYQPDLGLQGRLDVLHLGKDEGVSHIIELKSGKTFMPNKYGLNAGHYVQTLLYDLLVKYAMPGERILSYILYCKEYERPLRNAPVAQEQQLEALQIRNRIILWERYLAKMNGSTKDVKFFTSLDPEQLRVFGFIKRDLDNFKRVFNQLNPVEQKYFAGFTGFLSREYHLSKVGMHHSERNHGLAAIWRESQKQKTDRFALLNALRLKESDIEEDHTLRLERTDSTDPLANFRVGDIAILYPEEQENEPARGEVFKCSIVAIDEKGISVRMRNIQINDGKFTIGSKWSLEHDVFDSSFNRAFQNLFLWASTPAGKRSIFMGLKEPRHGKPGHEQCDPMLTEEQRNILSKMDAASDYFLLWGPPGTGKTSVMLRHYVQYLIGKGEQRIMLMAYTNRAVDEICTTLEEIRKELDFDYIRIGSRYGTDPQFSPHLLQEKVKSVHTRDELKQMLSEHKVYVSTVASFSGKTSLLELVKFDLAIIDEASQLLEPMMGNIIHHFAKIVMIGDHLQLPAVVQQSMKSATVDDPDLKEAGIYFLGNSLFERLFKKARKNGWEWAYDTLSRQGRMHEDIVKFPSEHFYRNGLLTLSHIKDMEERLFGRPQLNAIPEGIPESIAFERMLYIPSQVEEDEKLGKTNLDEALKTIELIRKYRAIWEANNWNWDGQTLGVITPFRAQIAQIRKHLWALGEEWTEQITVDTVERYQGGAREIIILSLCANHPAQWEAIVSQNDEGIDRKLNVAITRARAYFALIANPEMVELQSLYSKLKSQCFELEISLE